MKNNKINLSFPRFVVGNLPLSMLLLKEEQQPCFNKKVEDPRQKPSGMTLCFMGFTLIELLVVVLIIGILAAVAVPQYQKAVEKSRATQALTMLKSVVQAAEAYYMANGEEFSSFDELSLDIPWPKASRVIGMSQDTRSNGQWALEIEDSSASGAIILFMTQLQGKYKGAGFSICLNNKNDHRGTMKIGCFERKNSSQKTFDTSLAEGAFCGQIMQGTFSSESTWQRSYTLP